jgi:hypothetical protein
MNEYNYFDSMMKSLFEITVKNDEYEEDEKIELIDDDFRQRQNDINEEFKNLWK